jgi:hypothetical protein
VSSTSVSADAVSVPLSQGTAANARAATAAIVLTWGWAARTATMAAAVEASR